MGGTWDATNVADARVAVVTPVALDHAEYLGPDVGTIAGEKAGIIKRRRDRRARPPGAGGARRPGAPGRRGGGRRRPGGHRVRRAGAAGRRRRAAGAAAGPGRRVRGDLPAAVRRAPGAERGRRRWPRSRRSSAPARPPGRSSRRPSAPRSRAVRSPGRLERVRTSPDRAGRRRAQPGRDGGDRRRDQGVLRLHPAGRRRRLRRAARTSPGCSPRSRTSAPSSSSPRTARRGRCRPTSSARWRSTSSAPTGSASQPRLAEAIEEAIELAEAGPDDALGGSGVLVTGSVITAGEARTPDGRTAVVTAPDPVRAGRALGGAAAGILVLEGMATLFVPRGIAQSGDGADRRPADLPAGAGRRPHPGGGRAASSAGRARRHRAAGAAAAHRPVQQRDVVRRAAPSC